MWWHSLTDADIDILNKTGETMFDGALDAIEELEHSYKAGCLVDMLSCSYEDLPLYMNGYTNKYGEVFTDRYFWVKWRLEIGK
jgi:hypothetical protein